MLNRWNFLKTGFYEGINFGTSDNRTFTVDTAPPGPPILAVPAPNLVLPTNTPTVVWVAPAGEPVEDYRLQVTSGGSFNPHLDIDVLLSGDSTQFQVPAGDALADAIYQWRVIARDRAVNTASSQTQNFTVDTPPPDPPVLVLPGSGDLTNDNTPFFEWTSSSGDVAVYLLRVTSGDINTGPFDIDKPIAAPTSSDPTVTPLNDATYRWRVTASDALGNTASSVTRTFTVDITAPGVPLPVSPLDNAFLNDNTPLFEWEPVAGDVFDYVLHVTSGDIIVGPFGIYVVIPAAGIPGTGHQTVTPLNDGLYRWQVIARDQAGNPQPYGIRTFTIDIVAPDAPVLLAPADNAILTTRTPFFDWDDSPTPADVAEYRLQVTSGGSFDQPLDMDVVIIGTPPATEFQTLTGDALADSTYGWRVIAFDRTGNTAISVAHSFTISRPPLFAETSLVQSLDADGVAVLVVRVDEVVDTTGDSFTLLGGIGRYEAEVTFDDVCMVMLEVRGVASFVAPQHTTVGGRLLITADQVTGAPQAPLILAKLVVRLTGDATTPCGVSLTRLRIFEALGNGGDPIPERDIPSKSHLRGDASGNGVVNSFDALVILQFVVGMPLRQPAGEGPGKLMPIEAASVFQDGVSGDSVSAFDALAIQQFLVELRDSRFLLK